MAGQQEADKSGLKNKRLLTERKIKRDKEKADKETEGKPTDGDSSGSNTALNFRAHGGYVHHIPPTNTPPTTHTHTHTHTTILVYLPCQAQQDDVLIPLGVKVSVHSICTLLPSSCHPARAI